MSVHGMFEIVPRCLNFRFVLPESPRWLLCKGRITEVKEVIRKAAAFNKRSLPDNLDKLLKPPVDEEETAAGVCELFRSKYLRLVTFCFLCIWFTMNLVYYGLVLNMNSFGGNIYLNSALAGLVEIPAIALAMYIINRTGKKWLFCATFFAAALACLCAAIVEGKPEFLAMKITFVMIGKFTISAGNTIMPVYTAELYPTAIRNVGVGACNLAAGFALILTPYLSMLTKIEDHLLMTLLTAWCIFGAIVIIFLPEAMQHHEHEERDEDNAGSRKGRTLQPAHPSLSMMMVNGTVELVFVQTDMINDQSTATAISTTPKHVEFVPHGAH
uniref:Major facilitator superfamily (MFS) profile domain-containing protein n=1 Tax=Anopheles maculatus TaxID=74869 RepID=A0A182SHX6_9DIPT